MQEVSRRWPGRLGVGYLALCGASSALVYAAILLRLPLARTYTRSLLNLNNIPPSDWPTGLAVFGCVVFLFGAYVLGALCVAREQGRLARALIVGFPLVFTALLVFAHPITSTDVYDYLFRGRMLARYGANPFVTAPWEFRSDPLIKYVAWKLVVTSYGPLWEGLSWVALRLTGEAPGAPLGPAEAQLLRMILAYKAVAALGFLLCGAAIWLTLGRAPSASPERGAPKWRWLGLYLWLWNPLALWETVGAIHNDVWMALFIVLAAGALGVRQGANDKVTRWQGDKVKGVSVTLSPHHSVTLSTAALLALTAGGLIKFVAFFFGPIALVAALRRLPSWRARLRLILIGGLACVALVAVAYAPFWEGLDTLQNVRDRRSLYTASWLGTLRVILKASMPEERAATIVAAAGLALLFAGILWATWRAWREPNGAPRHMLWLALWFLFVCNPWFQPWYVIWPLALAAAQPWRARAVVGVVVLCATALASYVVGGLILPALGMPDKSLGREAWMAAFITVPPLLVFGWDRIAGGWGAVRRLPRLLASRSDRPINSGQGG